MNFKFTQHCFGNVWSLLWDGTSWTGDNVSYRSNGKIENSKLYLRVDITIIMLIIIMVMYVVSMMIGTLDLLVIVQTS